MLYLFLKSLHILAVVLFVGNITTGIMWKLHGDRSGQPALMAHALAGIIRSDRWFTVPGVLLIVVSGVLLAILGHYPILRTFWIAAGIVLFSLSGILFALWVGPAQQRLLTIASTQPFDAAAYDRHSRTWGWSGALALLAPLIALVLMVFKPVLGS